MLYKSTVPTSESDDDPGNDDSDSIDREYRAAVALNHSVRANYAPKTIYGSLIVVAAVTGAVLAATYFSNKDRTSYNLGKSRYDIVNKVLFVDTTNSAGNGNCIGSVFADTSAPKAPKTLTDILKGVFIEKRQ